VLSNITYNAQKNVWIADAGCSLHPYGVVLNEHMTLKKKKKLDKMKKKFTRKVTWRGGGMERLQLTRLKTITSFGIMGGQQLRQKSNLRMLQVKKKRGRRETSSVTVPMRKSRAGARKRGTTTTRRRRRKTERRRRRKMRSSFLSFPSGELRRGPS